MVQIGVTIMGQPVGFTFHMSPGYGRRRLANVPLNHSNRFNDPEPLWGELQPPTRPLHRRETCVQRMRPQTEITLIVSAPGAKEGPTEDGSGNRVSHSIKETEKKIQQIRNHRNLNDNQPTVLQVGNN